MGKKENLIEMLDKKINNNHSKRLMECRVDDHATISKIEKDFQDDLKEFWITDEESKDAFSRLKKSHFWLK